MEDDTVLREATSRRDAALAEARRLDDFIRLYNDLRGSRTASLSVVSESGKGAEAAPLFHPFRCVTDRAVVYAAACCIVCAAAATT
jgi:hypothetical protein